MAILLPIYGLLIASTLFVLHRLGSGNYKTDGTCLERKKEMDVANWDVAQGQR